MPRRVNPLFVLCAGGVIFGATCPGQAANPAPVVPDFWFPAPVPALAAAAEAAGITLTGQESDPERAGLARGDSVTLLVEHLDGAKRRQWIVALVGSELSEKDRALPPPPEMRLFTMAGNELIYAGTRAALTIHVLGPVLVEDESKSPRERPPPKDVRSEVIVNGAFLRLGFARGDAALMRLHEAWLARKGEVAIPDYKMTARSKPFPEEVVVAPRAIAAKFGVTKDDEQAIAGVAPALIEFFHVASRTPGVRDIMRSVIEIPVWSILLRGGRGPDININTLGSDRIDSALWGRANSTEVYHRAFLLELNRRPALCCRMVVVEPHPPLVASAGILGLAAGRPDGKGPRLMIWLIASRLAPQSEAEAVDGKN